MKARWVDIAGSSLGNGSVNTLPLLGNRFLTILQFDFSNGRAVFSMWSVPRCYKQGTKSTDILLLILTLTNDRPVLSSERALHKDETVTVKLNLISGYEPQMVLETRTD
jgi:hypothetical protein